MGRRWSIERVDDGLEIRIRRAALWRRAAGSAFPGLVVVAASLVLTYGRTNRVGFLYSTMLLAGFVLRDAWNWHHSADTLRLGDEGTLIHVDGLRSPREPTALRLTDETTVRAMGPPPGWALQALTGLSSAPRVCVHSAGREIAFGGGLTAEEADDIVAAIATAPGLAAARAARPSAVAAVRRATGALGGRGREGITSPKKLAKLHAVDRRSPIHRSIGSTDASAVVAPLVALAFVWRSPLDSSAIVALAAVGLVVTMPALLRLSRTLFAGTYSAEVLGGPAQPGRNVTIRFALDRHAPVFEWIDIRLQYVREVQEQRRRHERMIGGQRRALVVWEGLYRLPEGRVPPGPDEHVDAVFALPEDAPPTPASRQIRESWRLDVTGRTEYGPFRERFRVIVLPAAADPRGPLPA